MLFFVFPLPTQCFMKSVFPITHKVHLRKAIDFLEKIYIANTNSTENRQLFIDFTILLSKIINILKWIAIAAFFTYITSPAVLYLVDDSHLESILSWVIPGTMPGSANIKHYIINQVFNFFVIFWAVDYYILFAMIFTFLLLHVKLLANIMRNKVYGMDRVLLGKRPSNYEIKMRLKNIILLHNELSA